MEYRRLGNTGLTVSRICLGCMSYGDPAATVAGSTLRCEWALKEDEARPFFKSREDIWRVRRIRRERSGRRRIASARRFIRRWPRRTSA
jgi:hypothetical protein